MSLNIQVRETTVVMLAGRLDTVSSPRAEQALAPILASAPKHVVFDLVWNLAGRRTRRAMRIAGHLMIGALAAWALPATWDYVRFMAREGTPVLGLPFMWVFMPFVALLAALVVRSAFAIWDALRGRGLGVGTWCFPFIWGKSGKSAGQARFSHVRILKCENLYERI